MPVMLIRHVLEFILVKSHVVIVRTQEDFVQVFCKREMSFSQPIGLDTQVSSEKLLIIDSAMQRSISLMNIRKRIGPNTVP